MATANAPLVHQTSVDPFEIPHPPAADPRLELVERIVHTPTFHKAIKLQALLRFIVEHTIQEDTEEITEYRIGIEVFDKGPEYSPLLDSSVRVQARQLRLKLHEYFDGIGRSEMMVLEIPKGSYRPIFRSLLDESEPISGLPTVSVVEESPRLVQQELQTRSPLRISSISVAWGVAALCGLAALVMAGRSIWIGEEHVPWPLASVMGHGETSHLILADSAYQIIATANDHSIGLNEYLRTKQRNDTAINPGDPADVRLAQALDGGTFTSFADVVLVNSLSSVAGKYNLELDVKSARDLDPRDLEQGNFILAGSPSSNPWVSLYSSKLTFHEADDPLKPGAKVFLNTHPLPGEPKEFIGSNSDDAVRVDYADLAVVPGLRGQSTVMLVQGLRHEATEAAARLLADPAAGKTLMSALHAAGEKREPQYFEAVLAVRAVAGIPQVTGIAAVRILHK